MIKRRLPRWRGVVYGLATGAALIGLLLVLASGSSLFGITTSGQSNTSGVRASSSTRDRFEEYYQLSWRADGQAGNTAIEAVYYFPTLSQRLNEFSERSFIQARTLQELQRTDDAAQIPVLVFLTNSDEIDQGLAVEQRAKLIDDKSRDYPPQRWQPFVLPDGAQNQLVGMLWFRKPDGAPDPTKLTLALDGIPGNRRATTFAWDVSVLKLDSSPTAPGS